MARYADQLLADGERVILRTRQHWLATIVTGRTAWAIFIASLLLLALNLSLEAGTLRDVIGYLGLGLLLLSIAWLAQVYWAWYSQDYLVTSRRVLKVDGILRKRAADSSLEKINDAVLRQGLFGRLLHFGDLQILTASDTTVDDFKMLNDAAGFKKTMLNAKYALEREVAAPMPSPPLRVPTGEPSGGQAAAPPAAGAAPATEGQAAPVPPGEAGPAAEMPREVADTPDEVTETLQRLADLRDRGAISAAEYEAKKAELLGRL